MNSSKVKTAPKQTSQHANSGNHMKIIAYAVVSAIVVIALVVFVHPITAIFTKLRSTVAAVTSKYTLGSSATTTTYAMMNGHYRVRQADGTYMNYDPITGKVTPLIGWQLIENNPYATDSPAS